MKKYILIALVLLTGCKTTQEIEQDRKVKISSMDNLDICFNLGMQDDFEYWKLIKSEQFKRQSPPQMWDVSDELCQQAENMGRAALARYYAKRQKTSEDISKAFQDAGNSVSDGYKNAAKAYGSVKRTNCQNYGNMTNCTTY